MLIPSQIVRLFKLAALQLFAVLLIGILFVSVSHAQSAKALSVNANINLEPTLVGGKPALTGNYQITCGIDDSQTKYGFGDMKLYYSLSLGDPDGKGAVEVSGLSGLYADGGLGDSKREGPLEVTGPLGGARVRAKFSGVYCHHDQQNSELITVWSQDVVIPPQISVTFAGNADDRNAPLYVSGPRPITDVPNVPAGKKLFMFLDINDHPQKTEGVVIHYEGAGVSFAQVLYDIKKDYNPMTEIVVPTDVGKTLKVWAEMLPDGQKSNILKFNVVADPDKPQANGDSDKPKTTGNSDKPRTKNANPVKKANN